MSDAQQPERGASAADLPNVAELVGSLFPRRRSTLTVSIDLDPVPGWGHQAEDHRAWLQHYLDGAIGHYHPSVEITEAKP